MKAFYLLMLFRAGVFGIMFQSTGAHLSSAVKTAFTAVGYIFLTYFITYISTDTWRFEEMTFFAFQDYEDWGRYMKIALIFFYNKKSTSLYFSY